MTDLDLPRSVTPVIEARFGLDGGAMFGIVPRALWEKTNPPDANNRISMTCRCLLVRYEDRNVLIDVGIGTKWSEKQRNIYNIHAQDVSLSDALSKHKLKLSDIDDVILTHLHFDHVGGVSWTDETGIHHASFPEARHWVQKQNWAWAQSPSARDAGSYRREDLQIFERSDNAPFLELIDGISEIMPGIEVLPVNGHTFGMQVVKITTSQQVYVFLADLIPTTSHLRDAYVMGYDLQPLQTVKEKQEILYHAAKHDWILVFGHDPNTAFARVEFDSYGRARAIPWQE